MCFWTPWIKKIVSWTPRYAFPGTIIKCVFWDTMPFKWCFLGHIVILTFRFESLCFGTLSKICFFCLLCFFCLCSLGHYDIKNSMLCMEHPADHNTFAIIFFIFTRIQILLFFIIAPNFSWPFLTLVTQRHNRIFKFVAIG